MNKGLGCNKKEWNRKHDCTYLDNNQLDEFESSMPLKSVMMVKGHVTGCGLHVGNCISVVAVISTISYFFTAQSCSICLLLLLYWSGVGKNYTNSVCATP